MLRLFAGSSAGKQETSSDSRGIKRKRSESGNDGVPTSEDMSDVVETSSDPDEDPQDPPLMILPSVPSLVFNSSNQLPSRSTEHNRDMATISPVPHILQLPSSVLNRILSEVLVTEDPYVVYRNGRIKPKRVERYYDAERNKWAPGAEVIRKPGILEACKAIREKALPIFYVGNSFVLYIQDFDAKAFEDWWQRREYYIAQAQRTPVLIADAHEDADLSETLTDYELRVMRGSLLPPTPYSPHTSRVVKINRKQQLATSQLQQGTVQMQVQYAPHWTNLCDWLCLYHEGLLPPMEVSYSGPELSRVAAIFASVGAYRYDFDWKVAEKGLEGHRKVLIADSAEWGVDKAEVKYDDEEEQIADVSSGTMQDDSQMEHNAIPTEPMDFGTPIVGEPGDPRPDLHSPQCKKQTAISISDDDESDLIVRDEDDINGPELYQPVFTQDMKKKLAEAVAKRKSLFANGKYLVADEEEDSDEVEEGGPKPKKRKTGRGRRRESSVEL